MKTSQQKEKLKNVVHYNGGCKRMVVAILNALFARNEDGRYLMTSVQHAARSD